MSSPDDQAQRQRVRDRFTRTARQFASFSLATRREEAEWLVRLAAPQPADRALDLACGPGTFACALAPHVRILIGLDLTAALLEQACDAALRAGLGNIAFLCGDAAQLPLGSGAFDLAVCGYSLHHFAEPAAAVRELARVVRRGGRVALVDLVAPEAPERAAANNAIERARDPSHARTLPPEELSELVAAAGLRLRERQSTQRWRSFDDWMRIAGWEPGDAAYRETRRLLEASIPGDRAGFSPREVTPAERSAVAAPGDLEFLQVSLCLIADKP